MKPSDMPRLPLLLAALMAAAPLACDKLGIGKMSPEKVCEKGDELDGKKGDSKGDDNQKACVKMLNIYFKSMKKL